MLNLAVIGDPISHSLSPAVHSSALDALEVAYTYEKVQVKKGELEQFLAYAKDKNINGFNLTMPHKVDILPYLYEMDAVAQRFQSVNTVKVVDGKLYGYNTDAGGYTEALKGAGYGFKDSRVVILGAGGVVRTLALEAAWQGAKSIRILNRTVSKAEEICAMVKAQVQADIAAEVMTTDTIAAACESCDILINGTPLGMHGVDSDFADFSFLDHLPKNALVSDLIYNPDTTNLLAEAQKREFATLNGLGMLIYQALIADQIYMGKDFAMKPIYEIVSKKVKDTLK
ncbi:MAG: shikimate dehydrogenase [Clostridia bacterium]|nr:shikimate dehydrogenase [Clostridia bacterium]